MKFRCVLVEVVNILFIVLLSDVKVSSDWVAVLKLVVLIGVVLVVFSF